MLRLYWEAISARSEGNKRKSQNVFTRLLYFQSKKTDFWSQASQSVADMIVWVDLWGIWGVALFNEAKEMAHRALYVALH